jgi:hypothetical protein
MIVNINKCLIVQLCKKHDIDIPDCNFREVSTRLDPNLSNQTLFSTKFDELKTNVFYHYLKNYLVGLIRARYF